MKRARKLRKFVAVSMLVVLWGCGAGRPLAQLGDDAGRVGARLIRQADELPNGSLRPRPLPWLEVSRPVADDIESAVSRRAMAVLEPHLSDLDDLDEVRIVLRAACQAKDLIVVGQAQSWEQAAAVALAEFGGDATRHARVRALAQELSTATGGDIIGELAVYSACEAA